MKSSWILLIVLVLILVLFILQIGDKKQNIPKCIDCNIIFVDIDGLSANHLGVYGYYRNTSPNIDEFARKSILFKNAYSQASYTEMSVKSLLTSSLSWFWERKIKNNATLIDVLNKHGYITAAFTGVLFIDKTKLKFDTFEITGCALNQNQNNSCNKQFNENFNFGLEWIKGNSNKKFFLYLHGYDLHDPFHSKYEDYFDPTYNEDITNISNDYMNAMLLSNETQDYRFDDLKKSLLKPEQEYHIISHYDGGILSVDELFGNFINALNKTGLFNKTVIVFFGDHGNDLFENTRLGKNAPSYATLHVPLIIYIPGASPEVIDAPVALMDVMPTILSLINITTDISMLGINLIPAIKKFKLNDEPRIIPGVQYIIEGDWILFTVPTTRLYDLRYDKNESNNLADKNQEIVVRLTTKYFDYITKSIIT